MNTSGRDAPDQGAADRTPRDAPTDATATTDAWAIVSYQMAGIAVWGGIGWLLDRWTGHTALFLPIGVIVGIVGALYLIFARLHRS